MSYQTRRKLMDTLLVQTGCPLFATASPDTIRWLCGAAAPAPMLLLLAEEQCMLIAPAGTAAENCTVLEYPFACGDAVTQPEMDIARILSELILPGKACVEQKNLPGWIEHRFARIVPLDDQLHNMAQIKDEEARAGVQQCLALTEKAFDAVKREIHAGSSELDVYYTILRAISAETGCAPEIVCDILAGSGTAEIAGGPSGRILPEGGCLIVDLLIHHNGYWSDVTRTFFAGEPDEEKKRAFFAVRAALRAGEEALRTCKTAGAVDAAVKGSLAESGYLGNMTHHAGHGVGYLNYESPNFVTDSPQELRPGMIVTLEPGLYFPDQFGIRMENNYLLTESGIQLLFHYSEELENLIL